MLLNYMPNLLLHYILIFFTPSTTLGREDAWSINPRYLAWALIGCEWSALRNGRFTFEERDSGTHWLGIWVDNIAGFDNVEK
jgi:hypothetical protein